MAIKVTVKSRSAIYLHDVNVKIIHFPTKNMLILVIIVVTHFLC